VAISGAGAGKTGKVLKVMPAGGLAIVAGLKVVKKTQKKSQTNPKGGFVNKDLPVSLSKLMLYCPNCKKGVRTARVREGGVSVRKCRICRHAFGG
jgi:large subunit ribosomal protein L24